MKSPPPPLPEDVAYELDVALAPRTTMGVGGPARVYAAPVTVEGVQRVLHWARAARLPVAVLGGGSNVLFSDAGFPGLVLHPDLRGMEVVSTEGELAVVRAWAGESWDDFVAWTVEKGLAGVECLSGIPGCVGAAPIQNIGAYGQEVCETIRTVQALDRASGQVVQVPGEHCRFAYRDSRFKSGPDAERYVVLAVDFALRPAGEPAVKYADVRKRLEARGKSAPSLAEVRALVLAIRREKGMVHDPEHDPDSRSCGSFFTNPILSVERWEELARTCRASGMVREGEEPPRYAAGEGMVKTSAAWLMERCGVKRGDTVGGAAVSSKHVLALTNPRGIARAADVLALAEQVREKVHDKTGLWLEMEPVRLGFDELPQESP